MKVDRQDKTVVYWLAVPLSDVLKGASCGTGQRFQLMRYKYSLLSTLLDRDIGPSSIARSISGNPFIPGVEFSFSISHSQAYYAIAFTYKKTCIGLDIESEFRPVSNRWVQRYLTCRERESLKHADFYSRACMRYWTQKEAYLKCKGLTIFSGLHRMDFVHVAHNEVKSNFDQNIYRYFFLNFNGQIGSLITDDLKIKRLLPWVI
ncbi:MAG: 4'-phosphopantetheinyl transferase superfamily protein [Neisseriaceae bacterium]